jgi:hypothetical protein
MRSAEHKGDVRVNKHFEETTPKAGNEWSVREEALKGEAYSTYNYSSNGNVDGL